LPPLQVDVAVMTGNVAQVFLTDSEWVATLRGIRMALKSHGHLVFETRRAERRAGKIGPSTPAPSFETCRAWARWSNVER